MFKAIIAYDGSPFFGWQKTKTGPSVQETLENTLSQLTQETVSVEAASRTDRGVHAEGQVVSFALNRTWPTSKLIRGANAILPPEIRILQIEEKEDSFHSTLNARGKEYHYRICLGEVQNPIHRLYSWHFHYPLDLEKMKKGAADLIGTHDFTTFANEPEENPTCTLNAIQITLLPDHRLQISILGDRFLYKMVRTLVGTLAYIGCGKLPDDSIPHLLRSTDRTLAGMTAPALGLYLHRVLYDNP